MPALLNAYEAWFLTISDETNLEFSKIMLRKMYGAVRDSKSGDLQIRQNV